MSGRSPGVRGGPGPPAGGARCLFILQRCLAIQLQKVALLSEQRKSSRDHEEPEYWMYDSGYLLFQVRKWSWPAGNTAQGGRCPSCRIPWSSLS